MFHNLPYIPTIFHLNDYTTYVKEYEESQEEQLC